MLATANGGQKARGQIDGQTAEWEGCQKETHCSRTYRETHRDPGSHKVCLFISNWWLNLLIIIICTNLRFLIKYKCIIKVKANQQKVAWALQFVSFSLKRNSTRFILFLIFKAKIWIDFGVLENMAWITKRMRQTMKCEFEFAIRSRTITKAATIFDYPMGLSFTQSVSHSVRQSDSLCSITVGAKWKP